MIIIKLLLLAVNLYMCYVSKKDWVSGMSLAFVIVVLLEDLVADLTQ